MELQASQKLEGKQTGFFKRMNVELWARKIDCRLEGLFQAVS
jgi:hypothetical protein